MKTSVLVDKVGRLVLPKDIREAIGVFGRMSVQVEVVGHAARISTPEPSHRAVSSNGGRLIYSGPLPEGWDSGEAVSHAREPRILRQRERRLAR